MSFYITDWHPLPGIYDSYFRFVGSLIEIKLAGVEKIVLPLEAIEAILEVGLTYEKED